MLWETVCHDREQNISRLAQSRSVNKRLIIVPLSVKKFKSSV